MVTWKAWLRRRESLGTEGKTFEKGDAHVGAETVGGRQAPSPREISRCPQGASTRGKGLAPPRPAAQHH